MLIKRIKLWFAKRQLKKSVQVLAGLETLMKKAGISRQARRYFWREVSKDEDVRKAMITKIIKEASIQ